MATQQSRSSTAYARQLKDQRQLDPSAQAGGQKKGQEKGQLKALRWVPSQNPCRRLRISASRLMPSGMSFSGAMAKEIRT